MRKILFLFVLVLLGLAILEWATKGSVSRQVRERVSARVQEHLLRALKERNLPQVIEKAKESLAKKKPLFLEQTPALKPQPLKKELVFAIHEEEMGKVLAKALEREVQVQITPERVLLTMPFPFLKKEVPLRIRGKVSLQAGALIFTPQGGELGSYHLKPALFQELFQGNEARFRLDLPESWKIHRVETREGKILLYGKISP